jgi:secreted Zn-dependent insulinase-like peptidase
LSTLLLDSEHSSWNLSKRCMRAGNTLHICPAVGSTGRLAVTWQWSREQRGTLQHQTAAYTAALLTGQAEGSLRAALRRRGWATAVEAYCEGDGFSNNASYTLFQV